MRSVVSPGVTVGLACMLLLAGCLDAPAPLDEDSGGQGDGDARAAPEWRFTDTTGRVHGREDADSDATVLFFMATWCTTCRGKTGMLREVEVEHAGAVRFLSVGVDPRESDAQLEDWKARYGQPWPHGVDRDRNVTRAFGVSVQSSVTVLDREGAVVRQWSYPGADRAGLEDAIEAALARA